MGNDDLTYGETTRSHYRLRAARDAFSASIARRVVASGGQATQDDVDQALQAAIDAAEKFDADERNAEIERKSQTRAEWATEVEAAAKVATADGTNLGRKLGLVLDMAASFVRHGSDLGGGLMAYRFKSLAEAVIENQKGGPQA